MRAHGYRRIEADLQAQDEWVQHVNDVAANSGRTNTRANVAAVTCLFQLGDHFSSGQDCIRKAAVVEESNEFVAAPAGEDVRPD